MKLIFKNKNNFNINDYPYNIDKKGNEIKRENYKYIKCITYSIMFIISVIVIFFVMINKNIISEIYNIFVGLLLGFLSLPVHEILHAIWYKDETYLYMDFFRGNAFVISKEVVKRNKYIFISLFPNIILGILPTMIGILFRNTFLCFFGLYNFFIGIYDFINIFYVYKNVPKTSKIFLNKNGGFWI